MRNLLVLATVGLFAQLVDGSLGMAYGVTSSTMLLAAGIAPAAASAAVHLSEVGTTLVSGAAHWRLGNIDWRIVSIIALPGGIGAFVGATVLSNLDAETAIPVVSVILLVLGGYVLWRFLALGGRRPQFKGRLSAAFLTPLGAVGGALDAVGGGGWGPVGTTTLLSSGRVEPRKVVGSIDTSEFVVAVGGSLGFLLALGSEGVNWVWAGALMVGGVIAAPIAAWLVKIMPARILGVAAGGLIVLTNIQTFMDWAGVSGGLIVVAAVLWTLVWAQLIVVAVRAERRSRRHEAAEMALTSA
ncbi:MAG TPA: sulfite exporter TauE/SafE family protein [Nocardioidaceae bacterium]|nr:sulfite exporter TauE/SafE family protein [Nocardioidaceae bacterium]